VGQINNKKEEYGGKISYVRGKGGRRHAAMEGSGALRKRREERREKKKLTDLNRKIRGKSQTACMDLAAWGQYRMAA